MTRIPLLAVSFLLLALTACSTASHMSTQEDASQQRQASLKPREIAVFCAKDIGRRYQTLGIVVAAMDGESGDKVVAKLKEEAAALGANAIADLRLEFIEGFWDIAVKATGIAIIQ